MSETPWNDFYPSVFAASAFVNCAVARAVIRWIMIDCLKEWLYIHASLLAWIISKMQQQFYMKDVNSCAWNNQIGTWP